MGNVTGCTIGNDISSHALSNGMEWLQNAHVNVLNVVVHVHVFSRVSLFHVLIWICL